MVDKSIEKGKESAEVQTQVITVSQPQKLEGLLETINLLNTVSERMGEDRSGDMGRSSTGGKKRNDEKEEISWRDQAIANLPDTPTMQKELQQHIRTEIRQMRKNIHKAACKAGKAGSAHHLNDLYARIRRLNSILKELLESSVDVIKRLYIRIFVDKQTVF